MEAHALHSHGATATAEFRSAGPIRRLRDLGKEWTSVRELPQQQFQSRSDLNARPLAGLPALVLEHTSLPIDILGSEQRRVGLSRPNFPQQFVIMSSFHIDISGDDLLVFLLGDAPFETGIRNRPQLRRNNRTG